MNRTYKFKWKPEKEELWVYVCGRKKSGVRYRFGKHYDNSGEDLAFPCNFCTHSIIQCRNTKNPLFPDDPDKKFSGFCAEITIRSEEIRQNLPKDIDIIDFVYLGH